MVPIAYIITVLIWGSTWYAIELQLGQVSSDWSVVYRFFFSALILMAFCLVKRHPLKFSRKNHFYMMLLGFFLFSSNYILVYMSTAYLTSGLVAVSFSMLPFFNIFFSRLFLKTPIEPSILWGALIGIAGLVLVFWPEVESLHLGDETMFGLILCVTATIFASIGNTAASAKKIRQIPLFPLTAWAMLYGAIFTALYALLAGHTPTFDTRLSYWLSFLYLSIFGSVIAFSVYLWLIEKIGGSRAAYTSVLTPIVALIISTFLENYIWSVLSLSGISLVLLGNLLLLRKKVKPIQTPT